MNDTPAVGLAFTATGQVKASGGPPVAVVGLSVIDNSGASNTVNVYDGTSTAGTLVTSLSVGVNGWQDVTFPIGRACVNGIYVTCTGNVKGTVWVT